MFFYFLVFIGCFYQVLEKVFFFCTNFVFFLEKFFFFLILCWCGKLWKLQKFRLYIYIYIDNNLPFIIYYESIMKILCIQMFFILVERMLGGFTLRDYWWVVGWDSCPILVDIMREYDKSIHMCTKLLELPVQINKIIITHHRC